LKESGFLRLKQIIGDKGDPKALPPIHPIPAIIPVGKSTWWQGVKEGRYPSAVKLSARTTAWRIEDIRTLIESLAQKGAFI